MKYARWLVLMCLLITGSLSFAQDDAACEAGFIAVEDLTGTVCVPENVERVVALEWSFVEDVLALGVQPVGVADIEGYHGWVQIPVELSEDVVDVGTRQAPNLEAIAALEPDLIITSQLRSAENYDELVTIAPTLLFTGYPEDMSHFEGMVNTFNTIATALGREAEAEAVLDDMYGYFDTAAAALEDAGYAGEGFILAQGFIQSEAATFRLFTSNAMAVEILEQVGLSNDWTDAPQQYGFTSIGIEGFAGIGDTNFFFIAQEEDRDFFYDSALWSTLPFVQNENAHWLGSDIWLFGGPLSAKALVDTALGALGVDVPADDAADDAEAASTYSYDHVFGTTEVPANPQRIVAADLGAFIPTVGTMAALGVEPVAVTANQLPAYLDEFSDVPLIEGQASYEALLTYDPDLIITPGVNYNEENYNNLSLIAPTVAPNWYWQTLEQVTGYWLEVGKLVNREAEAEQLVADLNDRIAELNETLAPQMEGKTVSVFQVQGAGLGALYLQTGRLESALLDAVGIERPENQTYNPDSAEWYVTLSPELLNEVDAWGIFVEVYADAPEDIPEIKAELEANPLWQQLDAVQNGRVFYVQTDEWSGTDPFVANLILDAIETNLTAALEAES